MVCSLGYLSSYRYLFKTASMKTLTYYRSVLYQLFCMLLVPLTRATSSHTTVHEATTADISVSSCFQKPIHIAPWGFWKHSCIGLAPF